MPKPPPTNERRRYVGGLEVAMRLPSGREVVLAPGDAIDLLPSEVEAIDARPDFTPITDTPEEG